MTALREEMLNDLRVHNLAENTQNYYLQSVTGLACYSTGIRTVAGRRFALAFLDPYQYSFLNVC